MRWLLIAACLAISGCSGRRGETSSLRIDVVLEGEACRAIIGDKSFNPQDMAATDAVLQPYVRQKGEAHLVGGIDLPYRCIGSLIYNLQRNGFTKVGFISEPEPEIANSTNAQ